MFTLDHIVIAGETLAEGTAWLEAKLGVPLAPGGQHQFMGTHNRLLSLGPETYLEVIAIDPSLDAPDHPRWFGLDDFSGPPRLVAWVWATDDLANRSQMPGAYPDPVIRERGDVRWEMTVPTHSPLGVLGPSVLRWHANRPQERLPHSGVTLDALAVSHPEASQLPALTDPRVTLHTAAPHITATFTTPHGKITL